MIWHWYSQYNSWVTELLADKICRRTVQREWGKESFPVAVWNSALSGRCEWYWCSEDNEQEWAQLIIINSVCPGLLVSAFCGICVLFCRLNTFRRVLNAVMKNLTADGVALRRKVDLLRVKLVETTLNMHPPFVLVACWLLISIHKSCAVSLYLIKHCRLIRMRFIDIKSLHVM